MRDTARQRFFFVHIQKAAGTSLVFRLRRHFGRGAIYPPSSDGGNTFMIENLLERWRTHRDETVVVTGHFPLCTVERLDEPFTTFTVLREPIERTLSYLRHHRDRTPEDAEKPLEAIYDDPFRFQGFIHNHMVKMFSLTLDEDTAGMLTPVEFSPRHLERAKKNLASVDVVGVQEQFDDFCSELSRQFGWDLGDALTVNRTRPSEVSDTFRARIADDNAMDVELYEFAQELVARRRARSGV